MSEAIELSIETRRRLDALFEPADRYAAERILVEEIGQDSPKLAERVRFAALRLSDGRLSELRSAVELAKVDWRDLLVVAGFADDPRAHETWFPGRSDCFVCRKHRGEEVGAGGVIYEGDLVQAAHGMMHAGESETYPGVLFVEPRRHVPGFAGLTEAEAERVGLIVHRLCRALEASEAAERVYVEVIGHHVSHLHVWLIPRYAGLPTNTWGIALTREKGGPRIDANGIAALCERIRAELG